VTVNQYCTAELFARPRCERAVQHALARRRPQTRCRHHQQQQQYTEHNDETAYDAHVMFRRSFWCKRSAEGTVYPCQSVPSCDSANSSGSGETLIKPLYGCSISSIRKIAAATETEHTASASTLVAWRGANRPKLPKISVSQHTMTIRNGFAIVDFSRSS